MVLVSGCSSFSSNPPPRHGPRPRGWEITENLAITISGKDFDLEVLQVIVMPEHITLICAVSGDLGKNDINKVDILDEQKTLKGQADVTYIREFEGGRLIAFTFSGNRQEISMPFFSIKELVGKDNEIISVEWDVAPVKLPQNGEDGGGTFMSGVTSSKIGDVTIFSSGNSVSKEGKGNDLLGGPNNIASFRMEVSENGKYSWLYLLVSREGTVHEISEDEYMKISLQ
jgi:hypothetical protein